MRANNLWDFLKDYENVNDGLGALLHTPYNNRGFETALFRHGDMLRKTFGEPEQPFRITDKNGDLAYRYVRAIEEFTQRLIYEKGHPDDEDSYIPYVGILNNAILDIKGELFDFLDSLSYDTLLFVLSFTMAGNQYLIEEYLLTRRRDVLLSYISYEPPLANTYDDEVLYQYNTYDSIYVTLKAIEGDIIEYEDVPAIDTYDDPEPKVTKVHDVLSVVLGRSDPYEDSRPRLTIKSILLAAESSLREARELVAKLYKQGVSCEVLFDTLVNDMVYYSNNVVGLLQYSIYGPDYNVKLRAENAIRLECNKHIMQWDRTQFTSRYAGGRLDTLLRSDEV